MTNITPWHQAEPLNECLATFGNSNHALHHIKYFEKQIEIYKEYNKPLTEAPNYYAWLSIIAEYTFYNARQAIFVHSSANDPKAFNLNYTATTERLRSIFPGLEPAIVSDLERLLCIRHIIVHKGFPNLHFEPTNHGQGAANHSLKDLWLIRNTIASPDCFHEIRDVFWRTVNAVSKIGGNLELHI